MANKTGKAKKFVEKVALMTIIFFGFIGAIILGIVFHEYSHASDFKEVAINSEICGLTLPTNAKDIMSTKLGYFSFEFDEEKDAQKVSSIDRYTEIKAYAISFFVFLIFLVCFTIVTRKEIISYFESKFDSKAIVENEGYVPINLVRVEKEIGSY